MREGKVVQSIRFKHTNVIHWNPAIAVDFFDKWAADEIVALDVSRTPENRQLFYDVISDLSKKCFVPLTIGGWVYSKNEVRKLLRLGADRIVINTEAVRNPILVSECARAFGSQCIVVSIDTKRHEDGTYEMYIDRGREPTGLSPFSWARKVQELGAGEIFLNCINRDGVREGYDLSLLRKVVKSVDIPVIAMGGVFTWQHLVDGVIRGGADGVAAANIFHYTEHSAKRAKEFMKKAGIDMR